MARRVPLVSYIDGERKEIGTALVNDDGTITMFEMDKDHQLSKEILANFSMAGAFSIAPIYPPRPKKEE